MVNVSCSLDLVISWVVCDRVMPEMLLQDQRIWSQGLREALQGSLPQPVIMCEVYQYWHRS